MKAAVVGLAALALLLSAACGGGGDTTALRTQVAALQTQGNEPSPTAAALSSPAPAPTASPTLAPVGPTATSLADPKAAARGEAALGILETVSSAKLLNSTIKSTVDAASLGVPSATLAGGLRVAVQGCDFYNERYEARFLPTLELWPRPYSRVRLEFLSACTAISTPAPFNWDKLLERGALALDVTVFKPLSGALDALPDYSPAQLNRAIAERQ